MFMKRIAIYALMLLVINTEAGSSELIDMAHSGNTLLKLRYDASGLNPVERIK